MKLWITIMGIVVGLAGGLLYYLSANEWNIWWGVLPMYNPFFFLNPYSLYIMFIGVAVFFVGLFLKGGD